MPSPVQPRNGGCVLQPVAGLRRDLSSPGLRAGGDGEDLRHFSARGRGEPAGRFGRRRLPAPEHRGAAARGRAREGGNRARLDGVCRGGRDGLLPGWKIKRDAKLRKGGKVDGATLMLPAK